MEIRKEILDSKYVDYQDYIDFKRLSIILNWIENRPQPVSRIIDVGCGNGNISLFLGSLGYTVTGIDISKDSIEYARSRNDLHNVKFVVSDAKDIFLTDELYDCVICSEVIEHLHNPKDFFVDIYKILNYEGVIIVTVPNGYGPRELFITKPLQKITGDKLGLAFINALKKTLGYSGTTIQSSASDLTHIQFFTKRSLTRIMNSAGFELKDFKNANFIYDVFPFSLFSRKWKVLQKVDCDLADKLPARFSGGFNTIWMKQAELSSLL